MKEYKGIFKAFTNYCYKHLDELDWKSYKKKDESYHYYRTKVEDLQVIVGLNLGMDTYFMAIKGLGDIGNKPHRMFFPSKLQRLFITLHRLEKNTRYEPEQNQNKSGNTK